MTDRGAEGSGSPHERARRLLAADRVEGLPAIERAWLDAHLNACRPCATEAAAMAAAVQRLRATPVLATPEMVQRTRLAVRRRAAARGMDWSYAVPVWMAVTLSAAWMLLTAPMAWSVCAWVGRAARLPDAVWQAGFLIWWFLPATVLAAVLAWRHARETAGSAIGTAHVNWGQP